MNFSYGVLTSTDFIQEVLKCPMPTAAFFVVKWSGNCHMIEPIMVRLAKRFQGQIKFCKVEADQAREITRAYSITEFPTVLFFASGTAQSRIDGVASESEILKELNFIYHQNQPKAREQERSTNEKSAS